MQVQRYLHLLDRTEVLDASSKGRRERIVVRMGSGRELIRSFASSSSSSSSTQTDSSDAICFVSSNLSQM